MHKKDFFPLYCVVHISRFHSAVTSNPKSFSPAATLDPRPRLWTRDRDIGPATATLDPRPATRDPRLLVKLVCEVRRSDKCSSISIFAVIYLKLLVQIDSLFSVKYCRRRKKSPQTFLDAKTVVKTGQTTPIKFLLDDVVT